MISDRSIIGSSRAGAGTPPGDPVTASPDPIAAVATARCIALTTFRRDGTPVVTPVWFNVIDDRILVTTPRSAWKVQRISRDSRVEYATCTQRGKVTGPVFTGRARILPDSEIAPVLAAKRRRYPTARIIQLFGKARDQVGIEITPDR